MTNNEVRVRLGAPIILEGNRIRLDQVLHGYAKQCLVQKTNGLYHASQGLLPKVRASGLITVTDDIDPSLLPCQPKKVLNIDTGSGVWQTYKRKVQYLVADEMVFYSRGEADFVRSALLAIGHLGSYTGLGFGEITDVEIVEIKQDFSFVKNSKVMRSIPVGVEIDIDFGDEALSPATYYQGFEDCYCTNTLVLSYIPTQI